MSERDLPTDLSLSVGDDRRIELPNHGGGGYQWRVEAAGRCVSAEIGYDGPMPAPRVGTRAGQVLHVTALQPGDAELTLEERRSWESGPPAATVHMQVHVAEQRSSGS